MRLFVGLVAGIILGFLLGGLEPRRQLAGKDGEIADLQQKLKEAEKRGRPRGGLLPLPNMEVVEQARSSGGDGDRPREEEGAIVLEGGPSGADQAGAASPPSREDQLRSFDLAVDAQRVRARQSRAALEEQAGLDEEEMAAFDEIVAQMNEDLAPYGDEVLAWAEREPETRDALGVAHEVTGILYEGQSALEELVGAEALSEVEEPSRQIWNYIDLESFRPAVEAQLEAGADPGAPRSP